MPLDTAEDFNAALGALGIGEEVMAFIQHLPPGPRKAVDFGPVLDIVKVKLLPLIDQVIADAAD